MNNKEFPIKIDGLTVDQEAVQKNRGKIMHLGGMLGGQYFTLGAFETFPDFDKKQREHQASGSLDFFLNRTPRRFVVRGHEVVTQTLKTSPDGTTCVIFNPGTGDEAKAALIDGNASFGETTDNAIQDALTGQKVIFANGTTIAEKANEYNQNEIDRLNAFIKQLCQMRDAIVSTKNRNAEIASTYEREVIESKPKTKLDSRATAPTIIVGSASETD